jgi:hypothetical protein
MIDGSFPQALPVPADSVPADFVALAQRWYPDLSVKLLTLVWQGYDLLTAELPAGIDERDLERSITQSLELRIRRTMSGDEPFEIQHGPYERETMQPPPAQPPQYDLAFILREDERLMWPLEAKVLKTDKAVGKYINDLKNEFLTCRYSPFSSQAAMLGYLLRGKPDSLLECLETKLDCALVAHPKFPNRACRTSEHFRSVPTGKSYPATFSCHHLILPFPNLLRSRKRKPK